MPGGTANLGIFMKQADDMSQQEFFLEVLKTQEGVSGVEIKGSTKEERTAQMKKVFMEVCQSGLLERS